MVQHSIRRIQPTEPFCDLLKVAAARHIFFCQTKWQQKTTQVQQKSTQVQQQERKKTYQVDPMNNYPNSAPYSNFAQPTFLKKGAAKASSASAELPPGVVNGVVLGPEAFGNDLDQYYQYLSTYHLPQEHYINAGVSGYSTKAFRGGSNAGKYSESSSPFCGPASGSPFNTYPVTNPGRARAAKSYARHAPNEQGIRDCVDFVEARNGWNRRMPQAEYAAGVGDQLKAQKYLQPPMQQPYFGNPEQFYTVAQPIYQNIDGQTIRLARSTEKAQFPTSRSAYRNAKYSSY